VYCVFTYLWAISSSELEVFFRPTLLLCGLGLLMDVGFRGPLEDAMDVEILMVMAEGSFGPYRQSLQAKG
jgi:hypothetical protein